MFILKSFSNTADIADFKNKIISQTNPFINGHHRPDGLYAKIRNKTITILNVENDFSMRGANINIYFYGMIIKLFKRTFLLGCIGPSALFTALTLLTFICPFEYLHIKIIALLFWAIVYFGNFNKIGYLRELVLKSL